MQQHPVLVKSDTARRSQSSRPPQAKKKMDDVTPVKPVPLHHERFLPDHLFRRNRSGRWQFGIRCRGEFSNQSRSTEHSPLPELKMASSDIRSCISFAEPMWIFEIDMVGDARQDVLNAVTHSSGEHKNVKILRWSTGSQNTTVTRNHRPRETGPARVNSRMAFAIELQGCRYRAIPKSMD